MDKLGITANSEAGGSTLLLQIDVEGETWSRWELTVPTARCIRQDTYIAYYQLHVHIDLAVGLINITWIRFPYLSYRIYFPMYNPPISQVPGLL